VKEEDVQENVHQIGRKQQVNQSNSEEEEKLNVDAEEHGSQEADEEDEIATTNVHKCKCGFETDNSRKLSNHITSEHVDLESRTCDICRLTCCSKYKMEQHRKTHKGAPPRPADPLHCNYEKCDAKCPTLLELRHHTLDEHEVTVPEPAAKICEEEGCNFSTNKQRTLDEHKKHHKDARYKFACSLCGHICMSKQGVTMHLQANHDVLANFDAFITPRGTAKGNNKEICYTFDSIYGSVNAVTKVANNEKYLCLFLEQKDILEKTHRMLTTKLLIAPYIDNGKEPNKEEVDGKLRYRFYFCCS